MYTVQYLPHTADICLHITADTREELFRGSLRSMGNILKQYHCDENKMFYLEYRVDIISDDLTALLIDFLGNVLTKSATEKAVFCRLELHRFSYNHLKGILYGERVDGFDEDIKAVTYHEADVQKTMEGLWRTRIIFDI